MKKILSVLTVLALAGIAGAADISDLTKKADAGDAQAQYELGMAYMNGEGVKVDEPKAAELLGKAANKCHNEAMYEYGLAVFYGAGVTEDRVKGCSYLYTTTVDAAAYNCTQLLPDERTKALAEADKLKKALGK